MSAAALMMGFPPAPDSQVTLANWRVAPFHRWAFQHVREIVPSADIPNAPDNVWSLPSAAVDLSSFSFGYDGQRQGFEAFLEATDTDGIVVVHRGAVVAEAYAHGMTRHTPHILMSVSKSLLGIVAGILVEKGVLGLDEPITRFVPEVASTVYAGAAVRNLLDMRVGVHFDEDYLATSGLIVDYRKAQNWNPLDLGERPTDLRSFYQRFTQSDGPHGGRFHYVSPNTDLMGWVIERAAGKRYADLLSDLLWQPMGAERSAYITVDRLGAPRCAGGVCATVMDLARVGQLIVQNGRRGGTQIIPERWIDDLTADGDPDAWERGDFTGYFSGLPMHYRYKWYVLRRPEPVMFAFGVNGQYLFVDRKKQIVIAKVSSQTLPIDEQQIILGVKGAEAILQYLG
ncbi:MAG TPA: serine hydrolase [Xanthobacteraceae bacterium]|nr:serine hydrolase [Xanthobacteraceae bacterium]